ncbi:hypothetical protein D6D01_04573 [Aureobasidium pullulans]|uniref:Autophagy-related protein 2/VPS13 C-terminal domain-containing protein n=1 Tax=Aureobasidium pullulans TaxID=5580 RepID=A0A4S9LBB5_AURPU|nr:hypothetical protein D6D01_04573 [Aureobasidium pullulans]
MIAKLEEVKNPEVLLDRKETPSNMESPEPFQDPPPSYEESESAGSESVQDTPEPHDADSPTRVSDVVNSLLSYGDQAQASVSEAHIDPSVRLPSISDAVSTPSNPSLKAPSNHLKTSIDNTTAVSNAINNLPRLYGDIDVREPSHITGVASGLKEGAKALAYGFGSGFTGIITQPIRDGRKEGAVGFAKGLIRGSLGVVIKPTTAAITFASCSARGLYHELERKNGKARENLHDTGFAVSSGSLGAWHDENGSFLTSREDMSDMHQSRTGIKHSQILETRSSCVTGKPGYRDQQLRRVSTVSSLPDRFIRESVAQMTDQRYSAVVEQGSMAVGMTASQQILVERPGRNVSK